MPPSQVLGEEAAEAELGAVVEEERRVDAWNVVLDSVRIELFE